MRLWRQRMSGKSCSSRNCGASHRGSTPAWSNQAKASPRNYKLLDDLHTKPRTTYLAKIRHPNRDITPAPPPAEDHGGGEDAGHGEDAH